MAAAGSWTSEGAAWELLQRYQLFAPPPGEYHQFGVVDGGSGEMAEAVIVRTPLKRKHDREDNEAAESNDWMMSPGYANAASSPVPTPLSGKSSKISAKSMAGKDRNLVLRPLCVLASDAHSVSH